MTIPATTISTDNNLPTPRGRLVGRQREVEELAALLLDPEVPMVTIAGPGGAGKTRLALEVAHDLASTFRDGAWFVPLAPIDEPGLVIPTIADVLGIRDMSDLPVTTRLHDRLRHSEILFLLDNLEQVRDAGPSLAELIRACPGAKLLMTSRSILHLSEEHVYPIVGLPLPREDASVDLLGQNDAVRLFVARAQARTPAFRIDQRNAGSVRDICRRLDGLPLAIELAAARVATLSPDALLAQLSKRLTLLAGGHRDRPERHQALRDTVRWSLRLLDDAERAIFLRLAVFAGPFTAELAASLVAEDGGVDLDAMYNALGSLVDQSLARPFPYAPDGPRFRLLQTIREVALEQLDAGGEGESVRERHAWTFLDLAETAAPALTGPDQARWLDRLEGSLNDIRQALHWFQANGDHLDQLRLATALWRFGYTRGHLGEAREWLRDALARAPGSNALRLQALNGLGLLASTQGDLAAATAAHHEAMAISRQLGDRSGEAVAHNGLGDADAAAGERASAREHYETALALFRVLDDRRGIAGALTNIGNLVWDDRDLHGAVRHHEEALMLFREIDERRGIAWSTSNLGTLAAELGTTGSARAYLQESHELFVELGDPSGTIMTLEGFAELAHAEQQPEPELLLFAAASAIRDEIGSPVPPGIRSWYDDNLHRLRGRLGQSFDRIWAEGRALSPAQSLAYALDLSHAPAIAPAEPVAPLPQSDHGLSPRELDVVRLIAQGRTSQQIADELYISVRTVGTHISHIFRKLDVPTRSAIAAYAHREGLV
jgi:non-specific serine/threonine protein kinase